MLTIPNYIAATNYSGIEVNYKPVTSVIYNRQSPELEPILDKLSFRANLALGTAIAEWIAWRLDGLSTYKAPLQFIEAAWVANIDLCYIKRWQAATEPLANTLKGPILGVLYLSNQLLSSIIKDTKEWENGITIHVIYLIFLTRHIYTKKYFDSWLKAILPRLNALYPRGRSNKDKLGPPVPREALDPNYNFKIESTEELLNTFLKKINYQNNPFLFLPEKLIQNKFKI